MKIASKETCPHGTIIGVEIQHQHNLNRWAGVGSDFGGFSKMLSKHRDVITYDPRGLGSSTKLESSLSSTIDNPGCTFCSPILFHPHNPPNNDQDHAIYAFLSKILGKRLTSKFIESRLSHVGDVAAGINNQLSALSRFDGVDMLKSIKTNTNTNIVIIHGTEDEIIPYENATLMKRICDSNKNNDDNGTERSSLIKMENESHFFFITNAIKTCDEVNRAMK